MPDQFSSPGTFSVDIVGESYYQDALERAAGGRTEALVRAQATLVCEADNPHDPLAVRVEIGGKTVGHLARDVAPVWRRYLAAIGHPNVDVHCDAVIVGGWDRGDGDRGYFGVKLDLPPESVREPGRSRRRKQAAAIPVVRPRPKPRRKKRPVTSLGDYAVLGCAAIILLFVACGCFGIFGGKGPPQAAGTAATNR